MTVHLFRHPTSYPTRYQEIAARLEQGLRHHHCYGGYLPVEQQLTTRFDVNHHILCRVIDQPVEHDWIQRRQGVSVPVPMQSIDCPPNAQARSSQNLLGQGSDPTSEKLLSMSCPVSAYVVEAFDINESENIIHLHTLCRVSGVALCLIGHYSADLRSWPVSQTFSHGSLHDLLRGELDVKLTRARTKISACRIQVKKSKLLEVLNMAPLFCVRTLNGRQGEQTPIEYFISLARADVIESTTEH